MKERVLALCLKDAVMLFGGHKWKFYEDEEEEKRIKIEIPRSSQESYVIELPYGNNDALRKDMIQGLNEGGFIQQTIRMRCSY